MDTPLLGLTGALVTGAASSVHCTLMCGPLACAALAPGRGRTSPAAAWHLGRLAAYTAVGALLGTAGGGVAQALTALQPWLPWLMAASLLAVALDLGKRLPPIPGLGHVAGWLSRVGANFSRPARAGLLGTATPFLPCGLLYGVMIGAVAAGSPAGGAAVMGGFALGGVPALSAVQAHAGWLARRPAALVALRRVLPAVAAVALVWRALMAPSAPVGALGGETGDAEARIRAAESRGHLCH